MFLRKNKTFLIIFVSSLTIYLLSCFGVFDGLSEFISKSLYDTLGYTNRWSKSYGPTWFVGMNNNISSLGSRELVLIFSTMMYFYLYFSRGRTDANKFAFTVGTGIVFILITKSITSKQEELTLHSVLVETLSNFPSGHTFIATVLYFSIAQNFNSRSKSTLVNKYFFVSAAIIIALVGVSRFIDNGHTVTEVIAGWSLGLCWYIFAQIFLRIEHKNIFNK